MDNFPPEHCSSGPYPRIRTDTKYLTANLRPFDRGADRKTLRFYRPSALLNALIAITIF